MAAGASAPSGLVPAVVGEVVVQVVDAACEPAQELAVGGQLGQPLRRHVAEQP